MPDRLNVLPSQGARVAIKQKIVSANKSLHLLKRKKDILYSKLREITTEYEEQLNRLYDEIRSGLLVLARGKFVGFDPQCVTSSFCEQAELKIKIKYSNVVGVKLPSLTAHHSGNEPFPLTGLARGGQEVVNIRLTFVHIANYLAELASLKQALNVLKKAVRETNMRVNGLELIIIPRFENTLLYLCEELDELEREDFYRVKKYKVKQKQHNELKQQKIAMRRFKN